MKGNRFWIVCLSLIGLFSFKTSQAQNVEAISTLSTDSIAPGEQFGLELNLKVPSDFQVQWPTFSDTLIGTIEIVSQGTTETSQPDIQGNKIMRQQFLLTSFDTGWAYIPGINIKFAAQGDTNFYLAQSNPLMLRVQPVAIDTTVAFKPIKSTEGVPISFAEILPWIIGGLALIGLIFVLIWLIRKRKPIEQSTAVAQKPGLPPHTIAIEQLEELRLERLWQQGQLKSYYTRLSDIIRVYIEAQFPVNAVEMTTYEILSGLKHTGINENALRKLELSLELSDLVKFAKAQPTGMENDMSLNHLVDFVNESYAVAIVKDTLISEKETTV